MITNKRIFYIDRTSVAEAKVAVVEARDAQPKKAKKPAKKSTNKKQSKQPGADT